MSIPRGEPYVWVSWLAKLLAGEAHCQWTLWFRAHHRYDKAPSDLDAAAWCARHAALVGETEQALRTEGWRICVEDQNKFTIRGRTATLAGKPDLVAVKGEVVKVIDCKTGARKGSDCMQVLIYMLLLPRVHPECQGRVLFGEVRYSDGKQPIDPTELTQELQDHIWKAIQRAASGIAPPKTPSIRECRFCDITAVDCEERLEPQPEYQATAYDLF
jgi:CRISPR/Cas system-associated exonuclease Cas4 (RecB family)